jgi:hypothetical protein
MVAGKTYDYVIVLKKANNYRAYDWMSRLLLLITLLATTYYSVISNDGHRVAGGVAAFLILAAWIFGHFTKRYRWGLFIAFIIWIYLFNQWVIGILYSLAGILETQVKFKQEIGFDEEGLAFNSFPKKTYKWHEVNNVILKDNLLTIDLYNNRIIQKELQDDSTPEMEKEFNEFCKSHVLSVAPQS